MEMEFIMEKPFDTQSLHSISVFHIIHRGHDTMFIACDAVNISQDIFGEMAKCIVSKLNENMNLNIDINLHIDHIRSLIEEVFSPIRNGIFKFDKKHLIFSAERNISFLTKKNEILFSL